jgi:hypothetical protein
VSASRLQPANTYGCLRRDISPFAEENGKVRIPQARPPPLNSVPPLVRRWQKACTSRGVMPSPPSPNAPSTQIDRICPLGHIRNVQSGETLYEPNDSAVPSFVVLSSRMEVLRRESER